MPRDQDILPEPPQPPELTPRIRLYRYQWVGVAMLAALPVLALAGVFGQSSRESEVRGRNIEVAVRAPARLRYNQLDRIEVRVRNTSTLPLDTVRVALDSGFAAGFSAIRGLPELDRPFELSLAGVPENGTALAVIEFRAEGRGRHTGTLTVAAGADTLRVPLRVLVYP